MAKKIFIVEDEKPLVDALSEFLKEAGYEIYTAETGGDAKKKIGNINPDLILLDIVMPDMDGVTFLKEIRKEDSPFKNTSVIIFTNLVGEKKWIEQMGLSITDYIVKANSSLADLSEKIKQILGN